MLTSRIGLKQVVREGILLGLKESLKQPVVLHYNQDYNIG